MTAEAVPMPISPEEEPTDKLPAEPREPKGETIEIDGRKVALAAIAASFDPRCKNPCSRGFLIRLVPNGPDAGPKAPRMRRAAEICTCAIKRWRKANPRPIRVNTDDVAARVAAVADDEDTGGRPDARSGHVARLRSEAAKQQGELDVILAGIRATVAPLTAALVDLDEEVASAKTKTTGEWSKIAEIDAQIKDLEKALAVLRSQRSDSTDAIGFAETTQASAGLRAAELRRQIDLAHDKRGGDIRAIERKRDQVNKRIARIVERHPELAEAAWRLGSQSDA